MTMSAIGTKRTSLDAPHMSALGVKRTWRFALHMSAFDPKRTLPSFPISPFGPRGPSGHCRCTMLLSSSCGPIWPLRWRFVMGWVRTRLRFGSWLALAALAIQLAVSFGHIHAEDFAKTAELQATVDADQGGGNPSDTDHRGLGHHDCDICATISLLATLVIPSPPTLAVLTAHSVEAHVVGNNHAQVSDTARPFEARAPPRI